MVTVAEVNVAPVLSAIAPQTVDEEKTLTFMAAATDHDRVPTQSLTFSLGLVGRFAQQIIALLINGLIFLLEYVALLLGFGLFRVGIRQLCGNPLLPRINGMKDGLIQKALQQPYQNEKVERLGADSEPIDKHGVISLWFGR